MTWMPDGWKDAPVDIAWHEGPHAELRALFELAEDSAEQLDGYLEEGRVLVARDDGAFVGHLQIVEGPTPGEVEIKNMAVVPDRRGTGVGRALIDEAIRDATERGATTVLVATATSDVGNLRFYQRCGFRFLSVDRDAFTPETGYPDPIEIDGIELRDRIWLSRDLPQA
jgi:ribosomal protein S18 acetylase RimI-like enzyme